MTDVHIHIERGPYEKDWIDCFAEQAFRAGLDEIYLLEHSHRFREFAPMYEEARRYSPYQDAWLCDKMRLSIKDYTNFIGRMRGESFPVKIKWGLEVCYFPAHESLINDIVRTGDFDFVTGAVHWVNGFGFDHKAELWAGIDVDSLYTDYYILMLMLIDSGIFTGLAHPDSIKCFGHKPSFDLTHQFHCVARALKRNNMYAEQSGGLALNYRFAEVGLNGGFLSALKQNGTRILLASDAHRPGDVGANLRDLQALLDQKSNMA
ncbi:MAG: PHP domain-containing protein [Oscillospiraceae bacterium]|jgi:histidinol-phosphatase (PHP family)|nr:PHP domain-containing protein [Oscillospiraceae bacterium]